jgi:hypothetical protein
MLTGFFYALSVTACGASIAALWFSVRNAKVASELQARSPRLLLSRIESLELSAEELRQALTDLANRVKMQRVRNVVTHGQANDGEPDPYKNPDAWRKAMNRRLSSTKLPQ